MIYVSDYLYKGTQVYQAMIHAAPLGEILAQTSHQHRETLECQSFCELYHRK